MWGRRWRSGSDNADRGVPGAARKRRCRAEPGAAGARGGQGRGRWRRPADLPGDVPHRLRDRPRGGSGAGRAGGRAVGGAGRRHRRGPPASHCSTATPSAARTAASTMRRCCSTATGDGSRTTARRICSATLDRNAFAPGQGPPTVAELDGLKIGILICYDVEFPENVRLLALQGAELVAVPTANMAPFAFVCRSPGARARLREPPVPGLRQPLRPRGRARISRPVLHRRPPTAPTSRAPARRGADPRRHRPGADRSRARRTTPISPTAARSSMAASQRQGSQHDRRP